jgi:predicted RNA binding protein YcfA (HicA-like mRNA interferase family)
MTGRIIAAMLWWVSKNRFDLAGSQSQGCVRRCRHNPVSKQEKFREKLLYGNSDANTDFDDLCNFLERLGFRKRTKGSHHIFSHEKGLEIINLQPRADGKAKTYQVKQVKVLILMYRY